MVYKLKKTIITAEQANTVRFRRPSLDLVSSIALPSKFVNDIKLIGRAYLWYFQ
ncbi:hypothetical protein [Moraxella lacunata]|uniref:hypothetical protein n=1 Tax=Moraxella lacunata TaxID=477 RepID=UPI003EE1A714